jgi:hypothetical protein
MGKYRTCYLYVPRKAYLHPCDYDVWCTWQYSQDTYYLNLNIFEINLNTSIFVNQ